MTTMEAASSSAGTQRRWRRIAVAGWRAFIEGSVYESEERVMVAMGWWYPWLPMSVAEPATRRGAVRAQREEGDDVPCR